MLPISSFCSSLLLNLLNVKVNSILKEIRRLPLTTYGGAGSDMDNESSRFHAFSVIDL